MHIENRIKDLQDICIEEGLESIHVESWKLFLNFLNFLQGCGNLKSSPDISVTPDCEVYATWDQKKTRYFFRFMTDKTIRFGVLK